MAEFFAAQNIFLSITASLGNALILIALRKVTSVYPPTKLLFQCLAGTDLCVGLISQPFYAITVVSSIPNINWNHPHYINDVHSVSTVVLCGVSILTSTAISVDRLLALLLRLRYRHVVTLRRVRAVIICSWLLSLAFGAWMAFEGTYITVLGFIGLITLCLLTSLVSYTKIYLRLRHHQNQLHVQPHVHLGQPSNGEQIPLNIARYKKTVYAIAWVQLALLFCYLPFSVYFMQVFTGGKDLEIVIFLVFSFLYPNSSLNPILYCWKIIEVRQAVKDTVKQLNCCA